MLSTATGLPLSSPFFISFFSISVFNIPPFVYSKCRISVVGQERRLWNTRVFLFHFYLLFRSSYSFLWFSVSEFLSAWTGGWMEGKGVNGYLVTPHQAHPCKLVEGGGLWWCGLWDTGERCGGLVPTTAGSGRVGIWVLEVDSTMSCCMCRVLGVCFWHLFCYIKKIK